MVFFFEVGEFLLEIAFWTVFIFGLYKVFTTGLAGRRR